MILGNFLLFFVVFFKCILLERSYGSTVEKEVRKRSAASGLALDGSRKKISCDRGTMEIVCDTGFTVYITSVMYGRSELNSVCVINYQRLQERCRSPNALNITRDTCFGKRKCQLRVREESLGVAVNTAGEPCTQTDKYLQLRYKCVKDCEKPNLGSDISLIGIAFSVGSSVKLSCRGGYEPVSSSGESVHEIFCSLNRSWTGGSMSCKDIDECSDKNLSRCDWHADCKNTIGGYNCVCGDGYSGNGFTCNAVGVDRSWIDATRNETYDITTDAGCGDAKIYETHGILKSPNYPDLYPNNANCEWVITVMRGKIIEVEFLNFNLEGRVPGEGCSEDKVSFYDSPYARKKKWLATYCGSEIPNKVKTTGSQLRIEFKTGLQVSFSGFRATFKSYDPSAVCHNFLSPSYPGVVILEGVSNATASAGDKVLLGCEDGFNYKEGSNGERVCQDDNTWSDISNPCTAVQCGEPIQVPGLKLNGTIQDYHYKGQPLQYSCERGFSMISTPGAQTRIFCNKFGQWSNAAHVAFPKCQSVTCEITTDLSPPQRGSWKLYGYNHTEAMDPEVGSFAKYNWMLEYSCVGGYTIVGLPKRWCTGQSKNKWSGTIIDCQEDNGIVGLTNVQIAVITASLSGAVVLIVGVALCYCCIKDEKKKKRQRNGVYPRTRRNNFNGYGAHRNDNDGQYAQPYTGMYYKNKKHRRKRSSHSSDAVDLTAKQLRYKKHRPYMLPTVVSPTAPPWPGQLRAGNRATSSGLYRPQDQQRQIPHINQNPLLTPQYSYHNSLAYAMQD